MTARTECLYFVVPVQAQVVAAEVVVEGRMDLEPKRRVQGLHRPLQRAVQPHFEPLETPGV